MKRFLLTLFAAAAIIGFSYANTPELRALDIEQEGTDPEATNQTDDNGWKQGWWVIFGKDRPGKGYPDEGKVEEGNYVDDKKQGAWTKYHTDGVTPRLVGNYVNGRPNGEYTKFYDNGQEMEKGSFSNGKHQGVYKRWHENGNVAQEKTYNEDGKEDGTIKYYYENGQLEYEFTKENGVTVGKATRYNEDGSVKKVENYDASGTMTSSEEFEVKEEKVETGSGGPSLSSGISLTGDPLKSNGYNKVYNDNKEIWMDGEFKNGKLWDGKLYIYDKDGLLERIEIWKNGKYHSEGVVN